jgi:hypothetical protein
LDDARCRLAGYQFCLIEPCAPRRALFVSGDVTGCALETIGGRRRFRSREKEVEELVREAWADRIAILVIVDHEDRVEPRSLVFLRPPADL